MKMTGIARHDGTKIQAEHLGILVRETEFWVTVGYIVYSVRKEGRGKKGGKRKEGKEGGRKRREGRGREGRRKEDETIGACVTYVKISVDALAMASHVSHITETMLLSDGCHCISELCLVTPRVFS